jgi:mono/diheme cytochrome c family protein
MADNGGSRIVCLDTLFSGSLSGKGRYQAKTRNVTTTRQLLIALAFLGLTTMQAAAQSAWDGIYTTEQAERGKTLYFSECVMCHGPTLLGLKGGPALKGTRFRVNWNGRTADQIVELIRRTMPAGAPRFLNRAQSADLTAFIFSEGGFPAGEAEMKPDIADLKKIVMKAFKD